MAAGTLPKPGTEYGPCVPDCQHRDCAETRRMATQLCTICKTPIDYDIRFYVDPDNREELVHAVCLEGVVDAERRARQR